MTAVSQYQPPTAQGDLSARIQMIDSGTILKHAGDIALVQHMIAYQGISTIGKDFGGSIISRVFAFLIEKYIFLR